MKNLISKVIVKFNNLLNKIQSRQLLSVVIAVSLLLTTNVDSSLSKEAATRKIDKMLQQDDNPNRPKTTGEWNQQAKEVKGKPGERLKRIGEQSADAVKEFAGMYPEVAKNSAGDLKNSTNGN